MTKITLKMTRTEIEANLQKLQEALTKKDDHQIIELHGEASFSTTANSRPSIYIRPDSNEGPCPRSCGS